MISRIRGDLVSKNIPIIEILCDGLTYEILVSMETFNTLPELGSNVDIFVYLLIKEDSHTLFGFHSFEEKSLFMKLIKISGVGGRTAISILSKFNPTEFYELVSCSSVSSISSVPGIGKKTSERLILELKNQLPKENINYVNNSAKNDAVEALISLGYSEKDALKMVSKIDSKDSSEIIKLALKNIKM
jgi:Holliday junction DNA helicase RuvA